MWFEALKVTTSDREFWQSIRLLESELARFLSYSLKLFVQADQDVIEVFCLLIYVRRNESEERLHDDSKICMRRNIISRSLDIKRMVVSIGNTI